MFFVKLSQIISNPFKHLRKVSVIEKFSVRVLNDSNEREYTSEIFNVSDSIFVIFLVNCSEIETISEKTRETERIEESEIIILSVNNIVWNVPPS